MAKKNQTSSFFGTQKMRSVIILGIFLVATSVIIGVISRSQDNRQRAEGPESVAPAVTKSIASKGAVTTVTCTAVIGWACDEDNYLTPIDVQIYDGNVGYGTAIGMVKADQQGSNQVSDNCGGNAQHGFLFEVPQSMKDGKAHQIYAYGMNIPASYEGNTQILGTPKTIQCAQ